jgi:hypothetical protein
VGLGVFLGNGLTVAGRGSKGRKALCREIELGAGTRGADFKAADDLLATIDGWGMDCPFSAISSTLLETDNDFCFWPLFNKGEDDILWMTLDEALGEF